ncbi:MAG TPA: hypothetical protein ENI57_07905 [Ignavibacteria bacterium]|nr:hypothetical protein [Ignavibacteria bacterium]
MDNSKIVFNKLSISIHYGKIINNIFIVVENNKSRVIENFTNLDDNTKDDIKDLISKMATVPNFKSPKIRPILKGYSFGEIKPKPHRFFFFKKSGNNIIFFNYVLKKKDSLGDKFYKKLEKEKNRYEKEFQKYYKSL